LDTKILAEEYSERRTMNDVDHLAPVQIAGPVETPLINMDTLSIENDSIPDGGRSGVPEPESGEVELALANAMHQLDA
jgi:hypothetical protein